MNVYSKLAEHCRDEFAKKVHKSMGHMDYSYWHDRIDVVHGKGKNGDKFLYVRFRGKLIYSILLDAYYLLEAKGTLKLSSEELAEITSIKSKSKVDKEKKKAQDGRQPVKKTAMDSRDELATRHALMEVSNPLNPFSLYISSAQCVGDDGITYGSWSYVLVDSDGKVRSNSGASSSTNYNKMGITAALKALERLPEKTEVVIYTDNKYIVQSANTHVHRWSRADWSKVKANKTKNLELWRLVWDEIWKHKLSWKMVYDRENVHYKLSKELVEKEISEFYPKAENVA